jgi:hypothetical protein
MVRKLFQVWINGGQTQILHFRVVVSSIEESGVPNTRIAHSDDLCQKRWGDKGIERQ